MDTEVNEQVNMFLTAKMLYKATEDPKVQQGPFEKLGFYDDPQNHLICETIYAEWNQIERGKQKIHNS